MVQIISQVTLEEVLTRLEENRAKNQNLLPVLGQFLIKAVPFLTKEQAAYILNGSAGLVDSLVKEGHLQEESTGSHAKYPAYQVWKCFADGRTGRKSNFSISKITQCF